MEKKELIEKAERLLFASENRMTLLGDVKALRTESEHQLDIIDCLFYFNGGE